MKLKIYSKYDNSTKKGIMIEPTSYYDELKEPYDLKIKEIKLKIKGHLEQYLYKDNAGVTKSGCFISTSRGKDSVVMEHLVLTVCKEMNLPMIPCFLNNTLNIYPEEMQYWKDFNLKNDITDFRVFLPPKDENGKQITVWSIREKNGFMENFRNKKNIIFNPKTGKTITKRSPDCCEQLKRLSVNKFLMTDEGLNFKCSFDGRRAVENRNRSRNALQRGCTYETKFERPRLIRSFLPILYLTNEDRDRYITENNLLICPTYEKYDLERMGCRNCVAYKKWIVNLAKEPTGLGTRDLEMNLAFMYKTEPLRVKNELTYSFKYIKKNKIQINVNSEQVLQKYWNLVK